MHRPSRSFLSSCSPLTSPQRTFITLQQSAAKVYPPPMARISYATVCLMGLALLQVASAAQVEAWGQCGGISCQGGPCADAAWTDSACPAGSTCTRKTEFYWQCAPTAERFGQCGGTSCKLGGLCADETWAACPKGSSCIRQSAFYWQCKEDNPVVQGKIEPNQIITIASLPSSTTNAAMRVQPAKTRTAHKAASEPRPLKSLQPQIQAAAEP